MSTSVDDALPISSFSTETSPDTNLVDPSDDSYKPHSLSCRWILWYDCPNKSTTTESWSENLKKIATIESVEEFWA
jgi:Eukaryotic initiation factor 4E